MRGIHIQTFDPVVDPNMHVIEKHRTAGGVLRTGIRLRNEAVVRGAAFRGQACFQSRDVG
jgi:hypothetical protein